MSLAPIALFVYNRPWHVMQTVDALKRNGLSKKSDLFIFSDSPKNKSSEEDAIKVREYIETIKDFKSVTIILRKENFGLAKSIVTGVSEIVDRYGRIIVMEDDIVSSPFFLKFMNDALDFYSSEERIASISGYMYPVKLHLPETFFLRGADCWGWATWKRGWEIFEKDAKKLLDELRLRNLTKEFDYDNTYGYTKMLYDQVDGRIDSWAIHWHASSFLKGKISLYPGRSLVRHIGNDGSGTHLDRSNALDCDVANRPVNVSGIFVEENQAVCQEMKNYFQSIKPPLMKRIFRKLWG
ncbi:glycosyltransferase family 2 protein [Candidatus Omnitrophota bacterium]